MVDSELLLSVYVNDESGSQLDYSLAVPTQTSLNSPNKLIMGVP